MIAPLGAVALSFLALLVVGIGVSAAARGEQGGNQEGDQEEEVFFCAGQIFLLI